MKTQLSPEELAKLEKSMGQPFDVEAVLASEAAGESGAREPARRERGVANKKEKRQADVVRLPSDAGLSIDNIVFAYNHLYGKKITKGNLVLMLLQQLLENDPDLRRVYDKICRI